MMVQVLFFNSEWSGMMLEVLFSNGEWFGMIPRVLLLRIQQII
jgi:hypothetical protein